MNVNMFQSLLHQGNTSNQDEYPTNAEHDLTVSIPSSSGQYFQHHAAVNTGRETPRGVSIPSSSGQYFQQDRAMSSTERIIEFQSLLHQGNTSNKPSSISPSNACSSFNPFFIRAILPTQQERFCTMTTLTSFNPFFIRAI